MLESINHEPIVRELHRSLDERWRPEDVARRIASVLTLDHHESKVLRAAIAASRENLWSSMSKDFQRPCDMSRQLKVAEELFGRRVHFSPDDLEQIEQWVRSAEGTIDKEFGKNDFKYDRLTKEQRSQIGLDISRRQYNKRFRLAVRLERKMRRISRERFKRSLALASKSRLASRITWKDFSADANTACFIAYYVARCNLRSVFTNTSQIRPYDEICEALMQRCNHRESHTNWWAIAHVLTTEEVLSHLDDEQKGVLLADFFELLNSVALFLKELCEANDFREDMVVKRGNDSTTWNLAAGAWNKLRDGWFALVYALGMTEVVERMCPGKVLRLMAADVAAWHQMSGKSLHKDTRVFSQLPRPWAVLQGNADCPLTLVEAVCRQNNVDPVKSGWSAPKPGRAIEKFSPTPELVHGVIVASPLLATVLRKCGVFSGKEAKGAVPASTVDEIRSRHWLQQEQRRIEVEGGERKNSTV